MRGPTKYDHRGPTGAYYRKRERVALSESPAAIVADEEWFAWADVDMFDDHHPIFDDPWFPNDCGCTCAECVAEANSFRREAPSPLTVPLWAALS